MVNVARELDNIQKGVNDHTKLRTNQYINNILKNT